MKKALITGITGQDGAYLAKFLLDKGYEVYGAFRRASSPNFWRLLYLGIYDRVKLTPMDIADMSSIYESVNISEPDEIYNLAAQSFVGASFEQPIFTMDMKGLGATRFLEVIRQLQPEAKFYQASTSEQFGKAKSLPLTESSPFHPMSPYAASKLYAYWITRIYREAYKIFACNGILFNHESPIRGLEFVTRKISNAVAKISLGLEEELRLGNVEAKRDWGYAPEYVKCMWLMLQKERPDDYIVATNQSHSVKEFAQKAFEIVGLNWEDYVKIDKRFLRPLDIEVLYADYSKAKREIGWKPKIGFEGLVEIMVKEDKRRWESWLNGERFPWDAPNYPHEKEIMTRTLRM